METVLASWARLGLMGLWLGMAVACGGSPKSQAVEKESDTPMQGEQNQAAKASEKVILFFGDSITEGVGVSPKQAFPHLIDQRLDSLGLPYRAVNAGLGGETTSGGLTRLDWVLDQYQVDVFVLELGGNDGLRGIDPEESQKNLQTILDKVHAAQPQAKIILAGMQAPPTMGIDYTREFRQIFPQLARANDVVLIPFILEGVAGIPELNLSDGIHPTPLGHEYVADHVWHYLAPLLEKEDQPS